MRRFLFWTPRGLALVCALLACLLVADAGRETAGFWETVLTLLFQLAPVWLILLALAVAWRWEELGGALFLALGVFGVVRFWGQLPGLAYVILAGPLLLISVLFLIDAWYRARPGVSLPRAF